jgi:hypothetical protein
MNKVLKEFEARSIENIMSELELSAVMKPKQKYILLYPQELEEIVEKRDDYWKKKIEKAIPKKEKDNVLGDEGYKRDGFNQAIDQIKNNLNK